MSASDASGDPAQTDLREFAVLSGAASSAMIDIEDDVIPLDWIAPGDRVLTRDAGYQPVLWVSRTQLSMAFLRTVPEMAPVHMRAGLFGEGAPRSDVILSPSQLVPAKGPEGQDRLVSADTLGDPIYPTTRQKADQVTYVNVLLGAHHLIRVNGLWIGSLYTADLALDMPGAEAQPEMTPLAPILGRAAAMAMLSRLPDPTQSPRQSA